MDQSQEFAKEVVSGAISETAAKVLETEVSRSLLLPVAAEVGQMMGDVASVVRFYATDNMERIFGRWNKQRDWRPITEHEYKRVVPLLPLASFVGNEEMHELWASLLQATAEGRSSVMPSFGQTLSQLTPEEARFLDRIWKHVTAPKRHPSHKRHGRDELSLIDLQNVYDAQLRAPSPSEMRAFRNRMTPEQVAAFHEMTKFELILNDLERLSLLEKVVEYGSEEPSRYEIAGESFTVPGFSGMEINYALTQYGVNFIRTVRPSERP